MRKLFLVFFTVLIMSFTSAASGGLPDWILPELKKYPTETFLFNIGKSQGTGADAFKVAAAEAERKIAKHILEKVDSIIRVKQDEVVHDMVREHYSAVLEDYCSWRQTDPALKLEGFNVRNLSVDLARTDQVTYALVFIKRDALKSIYADHALKLSEAIQRQLQTAKAFEETLEIDSAIRAYLRTYPLYEALKEAEIIQIGAEYLPDYGKAFMRLAAAATDTDEDLWAHRQVIKRVEELQGSVIVTLDDILSAIEFQFSKQKHIRSGRVSVHPLIYEDSEMSSPFTQEFTSILREKFEWATVDAVRDFKGTAPDIDKINPVLPPRLSPSCWQNGDEITIRATLRDVNTGEFLAGAVVRFLESQQRDSLTYQPRGYTQVQIEKKAFKPGHFTTERGRGNSGTSTPEVLTKHHFAPIDGLTVDVWTDEGYGPLSYTDGDRVKIFARVNQPAYLRLLYTLTDQRRTLLVDNYYIGPSEVGSAVEIGEFLCAAPFGTELLIAAARTEEFPTIQTREEDGYHVLLDQDAESAAKSFRGLKAVPQEAPNEQQLIRPQSSDEQPSFQQSEAQLVLTIRAK